MSRADLERLPQAGVYVLVLHQPQERLRIRVGALGVLEFARGWHCYVGSAQRALPARLQRHLRRVGKTPRWHVDYLRRHTRVWGALAWAGGREAECALSAEVALRAAESCAGFGCSDCRCRSHLHRFASDPLHRLIGALPSAWQPAWVRRWEA